MIELRQETESTGRPQTLQHPCIIAWGYLDEATPAGPVLRRRKWP